MTRAAIYARYSSDLQSPSSIQDQLRECREYAKRQGWEVVEVYEDAAISGSSSVRPGYQRLLADARAGRFDIVLAEALDRLSRDLGEIATQHKRWQFLGIRLFTKQHGEITTMHIAMMGMVAEQYVSDLREKTRRGQRGRVLDGKAAGGLSYGYAKGDSAGDRWIVPDEAEIVVRIFTNYASGVSAREIAGKLNAEGVPGPRGSQWKDTTIRGQVARGTGILNNELYVGRLVYGRSRFVKDPSTGKRLARPGGEDDRTIVKVPELRIIPDDLWNAVKARQEAVRLEMPRDASGNPLNRAHRKTHVLSGLLACGVCDGPMSVVARDRYGCSQYRQSRACTNSKTIVRKHIEDRVLSGLKRHLSDPKLVSEFVREFHAEVKRLRGQRVTEAKQAEVRLREIEKELDHLAQTVAKGKAPTTLIELMLKLEQERDDLRLVIEAAPDEDVVAIPDLHLVYEKKIGTLVEGLKDPARRQQAIDIIQSMMDRVVVTPEEEGYRVEVHGELAAIIGIVSQNGKLPEGGSSGSSLSVVAGAGFEPATFRL